MKRCDHVDCLLAVPDLLKRMLLKCSITMVFTCPLLSSCNILNLFHIFISLPNLWFIRLQGYFPILWTRSFTDIYPLIRPPRRLLALDRGIIRIPGFIRSPISLAVYGVAQYLLLGIFPTFLVLLDSERRTNQP